MDTSVDDHPVAPEVILRLIKNALVGCKRSSNARMMGFVRGLEIGISGLQGTDTRSCDLIAPLQERSDRLSRSRNDYHLGVAQGIDVAIDIASSSLGSVRQ